MNEFEDIEQLLKPQCEFKASETLKQEVMQKAREGIHPRRIVKLWPWLAAACVVGFMFLLLMPPKSATDGEQPVAKVETPKPAEKPGVSPVHPTCRVKLTFAEEGDENAIPDVLGMLMNSRCRQR